MARFNIGEEDKFGGQGGGGYFSLKNDHDVASVRFLIDSVEDGNDIGYAVHEVQIDGKKRYVNCLREYGAPMDSCPFCKAKMYVAAKYFVPVYNLDEDRIQTWERGKKFGGKLASLCARYPHLVSHTFEIERNGAKNDTATTYEIYETGSDDTVKLEQFDVPSPLGTHILDKSADEMDFYLQNGYFEDGNSEPVRRRSSESSYDGGRRTPNGSRRDAF